MRVSKLLAVVFCVARSPAIVSGVLLTVCESSGAQQPAAPKFDPPFVIQQESIRFDIHSDGTYDESTDKIMKIVTAMGVKVAHQMPVGMESSPFDLGKKTEVEVEAAFMQKADGRRIDAAVSTASDENTPANSPLRNARRAAFAEAELGDILHISFRTHHVEAQFPNNLIIDQFFSPLLEIDHAQVELIAPANMTVHIRTQGIAEAKHTSNAKLQKWFWTYENLKPTNPPGAFASIHISTFTDAAAEAQAIAANHPPVWSPAARPAPADSVDRSLGDAGVDNPNAKLLTKDVSAWRESEKAFYRKMLLAQKFDVLVVPFQVQQYGLDRPTRSLMTAQLAAGLEGLGGLRLADPYVVTRALGEGDRRFDSSEVYRLADDLGVRQIIWGYTGHDRQHHMSLLVKRQTRNEKGPIGAATPMETVLNETVAFTDEEPPIERYMKDLPNLLVALGANGRAPQSVMRGSSSQLIGLPERIGGLTAAPADPARDALVFQLLAYLTPSGAERTRERFAEKSLLALQGLSPQSDSYRSRKARAFLLLGLRIAALHTLGDSQTPVDAELRAVLEGNEPDVKRLAMKVPDGLEGLIAALDANDIVNAYEGPSKSRSAEAANALKLRGETWPMLATRAFADADSWAQFENADWKRMLDREFPIADEDFDTQIRGLRSLGGTDRYQAWVRLSIFHHLRSWMESNAAQWCCTAAMNHPGTLDLLNLFEGIGEDNLFRHADFLTGVQGSFDSALQFLGQIETVYKGHPRFALARAHAEIGRAKALEKTDRLSVAESAYADLRDALSWDQGQTRVAADAFDHFREVARLGYPTDGFAENPYVGDFPFRPNYPYWELIGQPNSQIENARAALSNSTHDTAALNFLVWNESLQGPQGASAREALLRSVQGRFAGSVTVYMLRTDERMEHGDYAAAEKLLRESIRVQPNVWTAYERLGDMLVHQGRMDEASTAYQSFPGFAQNTQVGAVEISNRAFEAGNRFYLAGEVGFARRFYEIATRRPTGSAADVVSGARIKQFDGRYDEAAADFLSCAEHYGDSGCYAQFLELRFVTDERGPDWNAFREIVGRFDGSSVWDAAAIGFAVEGKSEGEIISWAQQQAVRNRGLTKNRLANALLRAAMTDRAPSDQLAGVVAEIALRAWKGDRTNGSVVQPPFDGGPEFIVGPRIAGNGTGVRIPATPVGGFPGDSKIFVKSNLVYFVEGVHALQTGDDASAWTLLQEAATIYNLGNEEAGLSYLLPYFAFAAGKAKHDEVADKYLAGWQPPEQGFDYHLARAVLAGFRGQTSEALGHLHQARFFRPFSDGRPITSAFEYAQVCEWLYAATAQPEFKSEGLDWARRVERITPTVAWSYALEAVLTDDAAARRRAIALANYLDPCSAWLARIPAAERDEAVRGFQGQIPFQSGSRHSIQSNT